MSGVWLELAGEQRLEWVGAAASGAGGRGVGHAWQARRAADTRA